MFAFQKPLTLELIWIIPLVAILQAFSYALGMLFGTLSLFIRDIREFVPVLLQVMFWLTPIIYPITILPEPLQVLESLNPVYLLIEQFRLVIVQGTSPDVMIIAILLCVTGCLVLMIQYGVRIMERHVRDLL